MPEFRPYHIVKTYFHKPFQDSHERSLEWLNRRFEIFNKYTLASLNKQTFQEYRVWFCCGLDLEDHVQPLKDVCAASFSFAGHYTDGLSENGRKKLEESTHVCVTRIDSDDLFHPQAMEIVASKQPMQPDRCEALMFQKGYLHDIHAQRWGVYHKHSSPFHTVIFPTHIFTDLDAYLANFYGGNHSKIAEKYHWQALPDFKFCVLEHGWNIGSTFANLCKQEYDRDGIQARKLSIENFLGGYCGNF